MSKGKKTIYYDGSCAACSNIMLRVDHSKKSDAFAKVDLCSGSLPEGVTKEQLEKEIHVIDNGRILKGYDAILAILKEYPRLKILVTIGSLPFFYQIGIILYKLFATNRHFVFGKLGSLFWTKIVVALGFLTSSVITSKLWMTGRSFPLVPVSNNLPQIPSELDYFIFVALLLFLVAIIFSPNPRKILFIFTGFFFFACIV